MGKPKKNSMNNHWTKICQNVSWCSQARVFRPRKPMGKLRPISPYETALLDETLQEFISRKEKRYKLSKKILYLPKPTSSNQIVKKESIF